MMNGKAGAKEEAQDNVDGRTDQEGFDPFQRWMGGLEAFCTPDSGNAETVGGRNRFRDSEDDQAE